MLAVGYGNSATEGRITDPFSPLKIDVPALSHWFGTPARYANSGRSWPPPFIWYSILASLETKRERIQRVEHGLLFFHLNSVVRQLRGDLLVTYQRIGHHVDRYHL